MPKGRNPRELRFRRFTPEECALIKQDFAAYVPISETASKLGRSEGSVCQKILTLGLRRPILGTRSAPEHLKALAGKVPADEWRAKYSSWQREQLLQARAQRAQAQEQTAQETAAKCAEIDAREDLTRNEKIAAKRAAGMMLQAIGEQHGVTAERARQIIKTETTKKIDSHPFAREKRMRKPRPVWSWRIEALMDVLGYGSQMDFAAQLEGVTYVQFNNIAAGRNRLSRKVADAIFFRWPGRISLEFLYHGIPGRPLDPELEEQLLRWQRRTAKKIFRPPPRYRAPRRAAAAWRKHTPH
jgi:hypothetical protein